MSKYTKYQRDYYNSYKGICVKTNSRIKNYCNKNNIKFNLTRQYLESIYPQDSICPILKVKMKQIVLRYIQSVIVLCFTNIISYVNEQYHSEVY